MTITYNRKPITLSHTQYHEIRNKLIETYGKKIIISWVCKRELGFIFREHYGRVAADDNWTRWYVDFYDDAAETMFRLKYL